MKLHDLAGILPVDDVRFDAEITGVSADSRKIRPGAIFVAITGTRADGASFAADAVRRRWDDMGISTDANASRPLRAWWSDPSTRPDEDL